MKTYNALIKSAYVIGYTIHKLCCILFGQITVSTSYNCYNTKLQSNDPVSNRFRITNCVKSRLKICLANRSTGLRNIYPVLSAGTVCKCTVLPLFPILKLEVACSSKNIGNQVQLYREPRSQNMIDLNHKSQKLKKKIYLFKTRYERTTYISLRSPRSLCIPAVHLLTSALYSSVSMHVTAREPLSRFSFNFILEDTLKLQRHLNFNSTQIILKNMSTFTQNDARF